MEEKEKDINVTKDYIYRSNSGESGYVVTKLTKDEQIIKEVTIFANYFAKVNCVKHIDDGVITTTIVEVSFYRKGKWSEPVNLTQKDIANNQVNAFFPIGCRIYPWARNGKALSSDMILSQCEDAEIITVNQRTGYKDINGEKVFLNGLNSITKDGQTQAHRVELPGQMSNYCFLPDRDPERYKTLLFLFCDDFPAPSDLMFSGVAFAFLTALRGLLREVKLDPRLSLWLISKTGSGKTSMGNFFLCFFGDFYYNSPAVTNFSSTANANERIYGIADSVLALLDDKHPVGTKREADNQTDILQRATRDSGDGAARARLNADSTLKETYTMKCGLIVTAEENPANVGESAIARSISVDIKPGDIRLDGEKGMIEVWRNSKHLNQCMGEYIQYVIANWDSVKARAKDLFDTINPKARTGGHNRLAESITYLQIGITIMCDWLISADVINTEKAEMIQVKSWEIFKDMSVKQNQKITEEKPEQMFVNAVKAMLDQNSIYIVRLGKQSDLASTSKVGYCDDNYYYFYPQAIFIKVKEFYAQQGISFPIGQAALFNHLADERMIEIEVSKDRIKRNTKIKRINGGNGKRYLWLRAATLRDEEEM